MLSTVLTTRPPRVVRLRRATARAALRHERRVRRSAHIWECFRNYYRKQPHLSSHLFIYDEWAGKRVDWYYDQSVHLEDQAYMLWQRLQRLRPPT